MSLEIQNSNIENQLQYATVACTFGDVFFVHLTNYSGGSINPVALDMPLLTDTPSPKRKKLLADDSRNNNTKRNASPHIDKKTRLERLDDKIDGTANQHQSATTSSINNVDFDNRLVHLEEPSVDSDLTVGTYTDISEFLIFHKKDNESPLESDPKLMCGCFVKLQKIEKTKTTDQRVTRVTQRGAKRKRKSKNLTGAVLSNNVKHRNGDAPSCHPSERSTSRATRSSKKTNETECVTSTKSEHLTSSSERISNGKSETLCDASSAPVPVLEHPKIILKIFRKKGSSEYECQVKNQFAIRKCSVVVERLQTLNSSTHQPKMSSALVSCWLKKNKNLPKEPLHSTSIDRDNETCDATPSFSSLAKTSEHCTTPQFADEMNKDLTYRSAETDSIRLPASHKITNDEECDAQVESMASNELFTEAATSTVADPASDDNCSVTSEISLYAPSLSDMLDSPNRDDFPQRDDSKKFRIPLINRTERQTNESEDAAMTEQVEEIFDIYVRNSPRMLSPVKELALSLIDIKQQEYQDASILRSATNQKKAGESSNSSATARVKESCQLPKCSKLQAPCGSGTEIKSNATNSKDLRRGPSIHFKNSPKLGITRTVVNSLAATAPVPQQLHNQAPLRTVPQLGRPINPLQQNQNSSLPANQQPHFSLNFDINNKLTSATLNLFEKPCLRFLAGQKCWKCIYSHELPSDESVWRKINNYSTDAIQSIYKTFIVKFHLTFRKYFPMICRLYGSRKIVQPFAPLLEDCKMHEAFDLFKLVYEGLKDCGMDEDVAKAEITNFILSCDPCIREQILIHFQQKG